MEQQPGDGDRAPRNVFGLPLMPCSRDPLTGFYRDGCCRTGPDDVGRHVMCVRVTAEFLEFSAQRGNDLSTPIAEYGFPGLRPGDQWCLCAERWVEAHEAGLAPPVLLQATDQAALRHVDIDTLKKHALDVV